MNKPQINRKAAGGLVGAAVVAAVTLTLSRHPQDLHDSIEKPAIEAVAKMDQIAKQHGKRVKFTTTYRPQSEQDRLYAQGRTTPGPKVTWLRTGAHNTDLPETVFGDAEAFDFGVFDASSGAYLGNDPLYAKLGPICEEFGLVWGGRWRTPDMPHCERRNWSKLK